MRAGVSHVEHDDKACFVTREGDDFQVFDSHCPDQSENMPC